MYTALLVTQSHNKIRLDAWIQLCCLKILTYMYDHNHELTV